MRSPDNQSTLTESELYQKFKKIKKAFRLGNIQIQTERLKRIKERLAHYEKTGNVRKYSIYKLKLDSIKVKH